MHPLFHFRDQAIGNPGEAIALRRRRLRLLERDDVALLVDDGRAGWLILPAAGVQPCRGVLGVPGRLAVALDRVALGASDQRGRARTALDRLRERLARRLLGDPSWVGGPERIEPGVCASSR